MRLLCTWVALAFATSAIASHIQHDRSLVARQTTASATLTDSTATHTTGDASPTTSLASTGSNAQTLQTSDKSDITLSTTSTATTATNSVTSTSSAATATSTPDQDVLPIQPTITPAIGIAGVIFIVGGLLLCFIGIKNRTLQIFLSTSFLVALSIEVLIVYVMNPPVSDAVQGGYLVAGVLGGAIIGGIAMIFKEVTEGLGCVLGGFTFAMWLLVLAPGGTIKSNTGRIVLIAVFCVVCFSLSFSHYTRHYGIMASTAFAGATIFILGIDCFSRAGLKEFWLYLWNLNPTEFPLGTVTYPVTRYIRVEIALNIIIAVIGVMSQIKLWKIIREKRALSDAERLEDEENRDQVETEIGRNLEARNRVDRAHWEGTYGDKDAAQVHVHVDSAIGSSIDGYSKDSTDVREHELEAIEMSEFEDFSKRASNRGSNPLVKVRPASAHSRSEDRLIKTASNSGFFDFDLDRDLRGQKQPSATHPALRERLSSHSVDRLSTSNPRHSSVISGSAQASNRHSTPQDAQTSAEEQSIHDRRGVPVRPLSMTPESQDDIEDAMHSPFDDDRASSIAATAAEDPDLDALSDAFGGSRAPSPYQLTSDRNSMLRLGAETPLEEDDEEVVEKPIQAMPKPSRPSSPEPEGVNKEEDVVADKDDDSRSKSEVSPVENLREHLPRKLSRAASLYRTTEWAKEAGRAEPLPIEDLPAGTLDAIRVDMKSAAEAARAEENNASQKPEPKPEPQQKAKQESGVQQISEQSMPDDKAVLPAPEMPSSNRDSSQSTSKNPYRTSMNGSRQSVAITPTPVYAYNNSNASRVSLQRVGSSSSQLLPSKQSSNSIQTPAMKVLVDGARNPSAPLVNQTLVESPAESPMSLVSPQRQLSTSASNLTLLDVREHKLQRRVTSTSFNALATSPSTQSLNAPAQMQPVAPYASTVSDGSNGPFADGNELDDEEEMTLAERKALVKEQVRRQSLGGVAQSRPPSVHRLSQPNMPGWPLSAEAQPPLPKQAQQLARMNSSSQQIIYDSHQPRRTSTFDQNKAGQNWSVWQSQKAVAATNRTVMTTADGQMDMLRQRRAQHDLEARQRAEQQQALQAQMDVHMRMGGMHDAHRTLLSRMQSKANKHASSQGGF